jgi:hypothetical protein
MNNTLEIIDVKVLGKRITVKYKTEGIIKCYFLEEEFYVEYTSSVENVGLEVAIIPFICNVLPIIWIFNTKLVVDKLDFEFYNSLEAVKKGYIDMYPYIDFAGEVKVNELIESQSFNGNKSLCLFSGGVDGTFTLNYHLDKKPVLISIRGADVKLSNLDGWKNVLKSIENVANLHMLNLEIVNSNLRDIVNETNLNRYVLPLSNTFWWQGFQHGIGMLGLVAPYAFQYGISKIYIASTYSKSDKRKYVCASDPTIDNMLKFHGCSIIHDGYDYNRQEKLHMIIKAATNSGVYPFLRVCFTSDSGDNCCICEKCLRTVLGIYAERGEPRKFGFNKINDNFWGLSLKLEYVIRTLNPERFKYSYPPIQKALRKNYDYLEVTRSLKWFYNIDIENNRANICFVFLLKNMMRIVNKVKRTHEAIIGKIKGIT